MNLLINYELFLAKIITFIVMIFTTILLFCTILKRNKNIKGKLKFTLIEDNYNSIKKNVLLSTMTNIEKKKYG